MADVGFGGSIPATYDRYLVPLLMLKNGAHLVEEVTVPDGGAVLETAAGTGAVSRLLRAALPESVTLVATDLSPDMVTYANQNAALRGLTFLQADATNLPFDDASFDAVVAQFGVMFFADKAAAYSEAVRVLRPGGRLVFNVWDSSSHNPLAETADRVIRRLFPVDPPTAITIQYNDADAIVEELRVSGFDSVNVAIKSGRALAPSARDAALAIITANPFVVQIAERGDPTVEAVVSEVATAFAEAFGEAPLSASMQSIRFTAIKA